MITLDATLFPLAIARWTGEISLEQFESHHQDILALLARAREAGTRVCVVVDSTHQESVDIRARKAMADTPVYNDSILGTFVVLNGVTRMMLTAMKWLGKKELERIHPCATAHQAYSEAVRAFDAAGVAIPSSVRALATAA
jgi:hypothetical protein